MAYIDFEFFSANVRRLVHGKAILPNGCQNSTNIEPPYRTLYLLTGYADTASRVVVDSKIKSLAEEKGVAVIILDGQNCFYVDRNPDCLFGTLIGEELVNVTRNLFPLSHRREDTFLGGMSMGGFGTAVNGCRYKDTFSKICMLAPACELYGLKFPGTDIDAFSEAFLNEMFVNEETFNAKFAPMSAIKEAFASGNMPDIFLGMGEDDEIVWPGVHKLLDVLNAHHIPIEYHVVPGRHDFVFMDNIYPYMFDFILQ